MAAVNGPSSAVVAGEPEALDELLGACEADGVRGRRIAVDYASHSAQVEAIRGELDRLLGGITPRSSTVPFYSTLTGTTIDTAALDAAYWFRNLRSTVEFEAATRAALADGHRVFLEVGPHPVLGLGLQETFDAVDTEATALGTLRRDEGGAHRFLMSLAEAHVAGASPDWRAVLGNRTGHVGLPTYAFQRSRYWPKPAVSPAPAGHRDPVDDAFWTAVESEDPDALAGMLGAGDDDTRRSWESILPSLTSWRRERREQSVLDSWRYRISWKPVTPATVPAPSGTWLVVSPPGAASEAAQAVERELARNGARTVQVLFESDDTGRAMALQRLGEAVPDGPVEGVVSFLAEDDRPDPFHSVVPAGVAATTSLIQAMTDLDLVAPLWCLTRGAVSFDGSGPLTGPAQAQIWGLGRVIGLEHPERWGGLIDLPAQPDERSVAQACRLLAGAGDEDQLAVRPQGVFARRLGRSPAGPGPSAPTPWKPRGTALITGGMGALGSHVARWLAGQGAEHLVLTGRRGEATPGALALRDELTALGARVTLAACDVADRDALATLVKELAQDDGAPVRAVVHAAGETLVSGLEESDPAEFARVMSAKAAGATHLDELFGADSLDAFVLFASGAGVWGGSAQGAYAVSNCHLDAVAERRRARGLAATSVAWGGWAGGGMVDASAESTLTRLGLRPMDPGPAVRALVQAVERQETCLTVADIDWTRFAPAFTMAGHRPLIGDIPEAAAALQPPEDDHDRSGAEATALAGRLAGASDAERKRMLLDLVRAEAAAVLGHPTADAVDAQRAFREMGFDSVMAVELRNRLNTATGLRLETTLVFDEPSPTGLRDRLLRELLPPDADAEASGDTDDAQVRALLATIPVARIRESGLLDALLRPDDAETPQERSVPEPDDRVDEINAMDVTALVRMATRTKEA